MKKIALLLALVMLLGVVLASCGTDKPDAPAVDDPPADDKGEDKDTEQDKEENKEEEYVPMGYRYEKYAEEDRKLINAETLDSYANTNLNHISSTKIKGIVIDFPSVDDTSRDTMASVAMNLATFGIAYVRVQTSPWDWGSAGVVRYADLVVDAVKEKYGVDDTTPLVVMGKGMGATSALNYVVDSRHNVTACAAEFPATDIERTIFNDKKYARTFITTFYTYDMSFEDSISKLSLIAKVKYMPDIPYYIVSGSDDSLVESATVDKFVKELRKNCKNVTYTELSGADHGATPLSESGKIDNFIKKQASAKVEASEKKEYTEYKNVTAAIEEGSNAGKAYEKYAQADAKYINYENINYFTRNNLNYIEGDIKGIVMEFPGLGGSSCLGGHVNIGEYSSAFAQNAGKQGILVMYMYCGPWSWGNKGVARMADLVIDALKEQFDLPDDIPVVSTGGSMGGIGALNFTKNSRHNVVGCMAACPCYDILGEYNSFAANPSFPRTYVSAVYTYDMPLADALKSITPCENIEAMPKVPYYIVCNENDECFDDDGMKKFAKDMEDAGHTVTFKFLPDTKHGEFTDEERVSYQSFIIDTVLGK